MNLAQEIFTVQGQLKSINDRISQARIDEDTLLREIATMERESETLTNAMDLLKTLSFEQSDRVRSFVASLVTTGVQEIFQQNWTVRFEESKAAGQRAMEIVLQQGDIEATVPEGVGGGVTQVISMLTQIALVYLLRSQIAQIIFFDESLSHLAREFQPAAARVLRQVSSSLNIQIVLVAHSELLMQEADRAYYFTLENGKTKVKELHVEQTAQE